MTRLINFDKRMVAPDLSNLVLGSDIGVKCLKHFPNARADRQMFCELENGDVCLTRSDGYNTNGPNLHIRLDHDDQYKANVYVVEHKVSGIRSITTDCRLFVADGEEEAEYDLIQTYSVDMYK